MSQPTHVRHLARDTNQALGIGQYAIDFMRDGAPDPSVLERTSLFFTDAVLCGASALALRTNAPTLLRNEALRYPARKGNDDLVMMVSEPETEKRPFGWSAVSFPGAVWFALKNVADFPSTLFWISNGGRPGAPWNGRHLGRLGVEEVCSHFCDGVADARKDLLAGDGIPTSRAFRPNETVRLPMIQGAAAVPSDFGLVTSITADGPAHIRIESQSGQAVRTPVNWKFLKR